MCWKASHPERMMQCSASFLPPTDGHLEDEIVVAQYGIANTFDVCLLKPTQAGFCFQLKTKSSQPPERPQPFTASK